MDTMCTDERLSYGELTVALYAAPDLPYVPERHRALSPKEMATLCRQGTDRLGGVDQVRARHEEWMELNRQLRDGRMSVRAYNAKVRKMWPDRGRLERCIAWDYQSHHC